MKKYIDMWKVLYCVISAMLVCFSLYGCQKTPENGAAQNKGDGKLETIINKDNESAVAEEDTLGAENTLFYVPTYKTIDTITCDETLLNGTYLHGNAELQIPNRENFPVVKYRRKAFSDKEVEEIVSALSNGYGFYDFDTAMTKSQIDAIIIDLKYQIEHLEAVPYDPEDPEDEYAPTIEQQKENIEQSIAYWAEMRESAPESSEPEPKEVRLDKDGVLIGKTFFDDTTLANIRIASSEDQSLDMPNSSLGIHYTILAKDQDSELEYILSALENDGSMSSYLTNFAFVSLDNATDVIKMSPEEAVELAESAFQVLGAGEDIKVSNILLMEIPDGDLYFGETTYVYAIELKRYINGMPILDVSSTTEGRDVSDEDENNAAVPREEMYVYISDQGIVSLNWKEPIEIVEVMNDNVDLASSEEIVSNFYQEYKNAYSYRSDAPELIMTEVVMNYGLARIINENKVYMAIPLWNFYGVMVSEGEDDREIFGENFRRSFITLNGIDSTRFNSNLGY